jgi:hypothetical protein
LTDENKDEDEDDDADMRLSFWRIWCHKKPKRPCIAQKTMAETVKKASTPTVFKPVDKP